MTFNQVRDISDVLFDTANISIFLLFYNKNIFFFKKNDLGFDDDIILLEQALDTGEGEHRFFDPIDFGVYGIVFSGAEVGLFELCMIKDGLLQIALVKNGFSQVSLGEISSNQLTLYESGVFQVKSVERGVVEQAAVER
jgi:hypothetical protein